MKSKTWLGIILTALLVCIGLAVVASRLHSGGAVANIYQDGVCIRSIDLGQVAEPFTFTVTDGDGCENLVEVEPGRICIREANCPDQVCVETGWISDGVKPVVCLPAKLVIQIEKEPAAGEPSIDAVSG